MHAFTHLFNRFLLNASWKYIQRLMGTVYAQVRVGFWVRSRKEQNKERNHYTGCNRKMQKIQ